MNLVFSDELDKLTPEMWKLMQQAAEAAFETEFGAELRAAGADPRVIGSEIGVTIVDDSEILELNREYRERDSITDVLSFPQFACHDDLLAALLMNSQHNMEDGLYMFPDAGSVSQSDIEPASRFGDDDADTGMDPDPETLIGDVVICYDQAARQAEEYGTGMTREMLYLFVHSVMHLFGYDHMEPEDKQEMRMREEEVLSLIGIGRKRK